MSKTWYEYTKHVDSVEHAKTIEATRDTESSIFYLDWNGKERRCKKHTSWQTWVDSTQDLERMISSRKDREEASRRDRLVRNAAHDLLEALELIVMERSWYRSERPEGYNIEDRLNAWEETARAAIAKAKGEQQC